jgi:hypothetical protein
MRRNLARSHANNERGIIRSFLASDRDVPVMNDELELAARVHYSFLPENYEDDWLNVAT